MSGRFLITIGSPRCPNMGLGELRRVEGDVQRVSGLLTAAPQNYQHVLTDEIPLGSSSQQIRTGLAEWFSDLSRSEDDCVVVYVAGHGDSFGKFSDHCLLTADSRENREDTLLRTADLPRFFFGGKTSPQNVLLILDVCYAGQGAGESLIESMKLERPFPNGSGFWVVVSADENTEAGDGTFVSTWLDVMAGDDAWLGEGGTEHLNPTDLTAAINHRFKGRCQQQAVPYVKGGTKAAQFIINPRYTKKWDGLIVEEQAHWSPKARGVDSSEAPGWFFTGRAAVLRELRAWLEAEASDGFARVVTGDPGSGKSAILGWLVLAAEGRVAGLAAGCWDPFISVHARGARTADVVSVISQRLGREAAGPAALIKHLQGSGIVRIVVDSLDEAADPRGLERELLRDLAACPGVRLVVGGRRHNGVAPLAEGGVVLDLDDSKYFDPADVEDYVVARLTAVEGSGAAYSSEEHHGAAHKIAKQVAARAGHSFLYARVVSRSLAAGPVLNLSAAGWEQRFSLPAGLTEAFAADLDRFDARTRQCYIDLMVPLAYARGRGLPQKSIWAAVATKIAGRTYTNGDLRDLKQQAGYYLVQDTQKGETVFRLFHQTFADYLKHLTKDENVEVSFFQALENELLSTPPGIEPWSQMQDPYLLCAYPSHAAAAGRLEASLSNPAFLQRIRPEELLPELHAVSEGPAWATVQAYRKASFWLRKGDAAESSQYLRWAALQYQAEALAQALVQSAERKAWWPLWARWDATTASHCLGESPHIISALCAGQDDEGNPTAVAGCTDGSIHVWRVDDGMKQFEFRPLDLEGDNVRVTSITTLVHRGKKFVVGVWKDGAVRAVDMDARLHTGTWRREKAEGHWRSLSKAAALSHGTLDLVAIADNFDLFLLELPDLKIKTQRIKAVKAGVYSLHSFIWCKQPVLLTTGDSVSDGKTREKFPLRLWSLPDLTPVFTGAEGVNIIDKSCVLDVGGHSCVLSLERHGTKLVCRSGDKLDEVGMYPANYESLISAYIDLGKALVLTEGSGHLVVVEAGLDKADPDNVCRSSQDISVGMRALPVSADLVGHTWTEVSWLRGRPFIMSADETRVRVWDLRNLLHSSVNSPPEKGRMNFGKDPLSSVAAGAGMIVAVSQRGTLLAWDANGTLVWSKDIPGYHTPKLIIVEVDGVNELLVGGRDGKLHRLDLRNGQDLRAPVVAGSEIFGLDVHTFEGKPFVFAAVNLKPQGREGMYLVRAWNLQSGLEYKTWESASGPDAAVNSSDWSMGNESCGGFTPELAMGGYYRTKTLYGVAVFNIGDHTRVALAGPHGEVQVTEFKTLESVATWVGGVSGVYIYCLVAGVVDVGPCVFGGDAKGLLFRGGVPIGTSKPVCIEDAHHGSINALLLRSTPAGWVIVSGGNDGIVQFWNSSLERLVKIETERPVEALAWLGESGLVVGTDRGIMNLELDWVEIFARG